MNSRTRTDSKNEMVEMNEKQPSKNYFCRRKNGGRVVFGMKEGQMAALNGSFLKFCHYFVAVFVVLSINERKLLCFCSEHSHFLVSFYVFENNRNIKREHLRVWDSNIGWGNLVEWFFSFLLDSCWIIYATSRFSKAYFLIIWRKVSSRILNKIL